MPYKVLVAELELRLDNLAQLLEHHPFFYSDQPSVADFAVYGVASTGFSGATPEFADAFSNRSELVSWRARMDELIAL